MTWHPDIPQEYRNQIVTGDARVLAERIPDESIDLIFTDPVYDRIDDYRWLAETAARVLKPDRACLVWTSTPLMSKIIKVMEPPLNYVWLMYLQKNTVPYPGKPGICVITQCLWFDINGQSKTYRRIADWYREGTARFNTDSFNGHFWSKPIDVIGKWADAFTYPGMLILDPFTGGGTVPAVCKMLNRNYIAFEIDPDTAELARERVRNTQPPLPLQYHEQLELLPGD